MTHQPHLSLSFCRSYTEARLGLCHVQTIVILFSMAVPNTSSTDFRNFRTMPPASSWRFLKLKHITPHLQTLLWLPVDARIQYKICCLCFNAINSSGPHTLLTYLRSMHPLANSVLLLTLLHCAFLQHTRKPVANVPFLTLHLPSGTAFLKLSEKLTLIFLSKPP